VTVLRRVLLTGFAVGLGLSITLSETSLALLTLLLLWRLRGPAGRAETRWPLWPPIAAFAVVSLVSALVSGQPGALVVAAKGLALVAALYVSANLLVDPGEGHDFLSVLLVATAAAGALAVTQTGLCPGSGRDYGPPAWLYHQCYRGRGFFSIYMTLAGVLIIVLLATLPRLVSGAVASRWQLLPWLVGLGGLVATYTRGAWLGFVAGIVVVLPMTRKGRWLLLGGLLALGLAILTGPAHLRQRLLSVGDPDDPTVRERVYMWRSGLTMWREQPWLGVGPGGVKRRYADYALPEAVKKRTGHLHNVPLQILVERGLLGLAAWLWIWGAFYPRAIDLLQRLPAAAQLERTLVLGSLVSATGFLVAGLSEYNFGDSEVVMVAWCVTALPFLVEDSWKRRQGDGVEPGS
jgi:O-Antigen ligase